MKTNPMSCKANVRVNADADRDSASTEAEELKTLICDKGAKLHKRRAALKRLKRLAEDYSSAAGKLRELYEEPWTVPPGLGGSLSRSTRARIAAQGEIEPVNFTRQVALAKSLGIQAPTRAEFDAGVTHQEARRKAFERDSDGTKEAQRFSWGRLKKSVRAHLPKFPFSQRSKENSPSSSVSVETGIETLQNLVLNLSPQLPAEYRDKEYGTTLHRAVSTGDTETARNLLTNSNVDLLNYPTRDIEVLPVHCLAVCPQDNFEEMQKLLSNAGADFSKPTVDGESLISYAARYNAPWIIDQAKDLGLDINAANELGRSPLFTACLKGQVEAVTALMKAGANPNTPAFNGATPAYVAGVSSGATTLKERKQIRDRIVAELKTGDTPIDIQREEALERLQTASGVLGLDGQLPCGSKTITLGGHYRAPVLQDEIRFCESYLMKHPNLESEHREALQAWIDNLRWVQSFPPTTPGWKARIRERLESTDLVAIPSGWEGHATWSMFTGRSVGAFHEVHYNRGDWRGIVSNDPSAPDKDLLAPSIGRTNPDFETQVERVYRAFLYALCDVPGPPPHRDVLESGASPDGNQGKIRLEDLQLIGKAQKVGNCSVASLRNARRAFLRGKLGKEQADPLYKDLNAYTKARAYIELQRTLDTDNEDQRAWGIAANAPHERLLEKSTRYKNHFTSESSNPD